MGESVSSRPEDGAPLRIWDVERLWELARDLPVCRVPLNTISDLDRVGWHGRPEHYGRLTIREVADHARRIQQATFGYPIILSAGGQLLDGFHRVAKAHLLGMPDIAAVTFVQDPPPDRLRPMPAWLQETIKPSPMQ